MDLKKKIESQRRINIEEVKGVICEIEDGNIDVSSLLVILENVRNMVLMCLDTHQNQDDPDMKNKYRTLVHNVNIELNALSDVIIFATKNKITVVEKEKIVGILERLIKVLEPE